MKCVCVCLYILLLMFFCIQVFKYFPKFKPHTETIFEVLQVPLDAMEYIIFKSLRKQVMMAQLL